MKKCNELKFSFTAVIPNQKHHLVSNMKSHDCSSEHKQLYCQRVCSHCRQLEESKVHVLHCVSAKSAPTIEIR